MTKTSIFRRLFYFPEFKDTWALVWGAWIESCPLQLVGMVMQPHNEPFTLAVSCREYRCTRGVASIINMWCLEPLVQNIVVLGKAPLALSRIIWFY